jgi:hypothetical protein
MSPVARTKQTFAAGIRQPSTNANGTAWITLTVEDEAGDRATTTFLATVLPVNDPPFLEPLPNKVSYENAGSILIPLHVGDIETPIDELTLKAVSSNPLLVPPDSLILGNPPYAFLKISPIPDRIGQTTITVEVADDEAVATQSFVLVVEPLTFAPELRSVPADLDNDGDLDLVAVMPTADSPPNPWPGTESSDRVGVIRNQGNDFNPPPSPPTHLGASVQERGAQLWRNLGGFEFEPWPDPLPPHGISAVADYNNDGWLDVLVSGYDYVNGDFQYQNALYRSALGESFSVADHQFPSLSSANAPTFADVDGDLDPDLLLGGQTNAPDYVTRLFRNDTLSRNIRPQPPGDLRAEALDGLVQFSWTAAHDANQTAALISAPGAAGLGRANRRRFHRHHA